MIALEKGDVRTAALIETCLEFGLPVIVPATVLAQVWRGDARLARISRAVAAAAIDPLGEARAKEVGIRLGDREAIDIADAHVICCAVELRATAVTSDSDDLRGLVEPGEPLALIDV